MTRNAFSQLTRGLVSEPATLTVYGGVAQRDQIIALREGVHVVFGTPGRVNDLIARHALLVDAVKVVVVAGVDDFVRVGFADLMDDVIATLPRTVRFCFQSSTPGCAIECVQFARRYARRAEFLSQAAHGFDVFCSARLGVIDVTHQCAPSGTRTDALSSELRAKVAAAVHWLHVTPLLESAAIVVSDYAEQHAACVALRQSGVACTVYSPLRVPMDVKAGSDLWPAASAAAAATADPDAIALCCFVPKACVTVLTMDDVLACSKLAGAERVKACGFSGVLLMLYIHTPSQYMDCMTLLWQDSYDAHVTAIVTSAEQRASLQRCAAYFHFNLVQLTLPDAAAK